jgi:hypothetical protein
MVLQQVGSYLGYTGRAADAFGKVARDPKPTLSSGGQARDEGFSPAGAGPLRRAASSAAIARLSARP